MLRSYNKRSSNIVACACVVLSLLACVVGYQDFVIHPSFWKGFAVATVLIGLLGLSSYYKTRKPLSDNDIVNIDKTMQSVSWKHKGYWFALVAVFVVGTYFSETNPPLFYGFGTGFFLVAGCMILLDNLLLHRLFLWNINDPRVKRAYTEREDEHDQSGRTVDRQRRR